MPWQNLAEDLAEEFEASDRTLQRTYDAYASWSASAREAHNENNRQFRRALKADKVRLRNVYDKTNARRRRWRQKPEVKAREAEKRRQWLEKKGREYFKAYYQKIKADPARYAAYLERSKRSKAKKRASIRGNSLTSQTK